jgi:dipeptidyl aminopeptidase/acylaminoacyl peptidase
MTSMPLSAVLLSGGRRLADPQLHPAGSWVTFLTRDGGRTELTLVDRRDGLERRLALDPGIASSRGGSHCWFPDGKRIAYLGTDGCAYVFDVSTLEIRAVTSEPMSCSSLTVSPDGSRVAFVADLQHVFVVDVDGASEPVKLSTDADFVMDPAFSAGGEIVAWHEWDVPNMAWDSSRIVVRDVMAKSEKRLVAGGAGIAVQQPRFSPDGNLLGYLSDESGWLNLWAVDAQSFGDARQVVAEEAEHGDLSWGPGQSTYAWIDGGTRVLVGRNQRGFGSAVEVETVSGEALCTFSGTFSNVQAAGDAVVALVTDVNRATELVVLQGHSEQVVARSAYAGVDRNGHAPEQVSWTSADGAIVPGRLYRAPGVDGPAPMIVWVHGGPHGQSPATFYPRWQYFLDRGWSVLVPDYRGSSGWGRELLQSLRGRWGEVDVDDVVSGVRAAVANGWCDASKVVAMGGSAGGLTVLLMLARHPALFAAGVATYPVTDLLSAEENMWRFEAHYFRSLVGELPQSRDMYVERSPLTHAAAIKSPVLLMHGTVDESVPSTQSIDMEKAINAAGGVAELHLYEGEGHGWKRPETQIDELQRVDTFLCRYVLDVTTEGSER